jgi:cytochrome c-type biogenesis protein CcmH
VTHGSSRAVAFVVALTLAVALAALGAGVARAQPAADAALDARLKRLELTLRCLVCQNQTLADSDAPLAADLRREIREIAQAGKSDDDIRAFLTSRYGDFVLYDPPVQRNTFVLWFGPFALLVVGAAVWWRMGRSRARDARTPDDAAAAERGRSLLEG